MKERIPSSNSLASVDANMTAEFETVANPKAEDILCGKDKRCIKHEGSRDFRRIIESYTLQYQQANSRQEKMDITKQIFDSLQSRRFLKFNEDTNLWETLHPLAVRDKIGHALRFSNRKGASTIRNKVRRNGSNPDICSSLDRVTDNMAIRKSTGNLMSFGRRVPSASSLAKKKNLIGSSQQNAQWQNTSQVKQNASWGLPNIGALHLNGGTPAGSATNLSAIANGLSNSGLNLNGLSHSGLNLAGMSNRNATFGNNNGMNKNASFGVGNNSNSLGMLKNNEALRKNLIPNLPLSFNNMTIPDPTPLPPSSNGMHNTNINNLLNRKDSSNSEDLRNTFTSMHIPDPTPLPPSADGNNANSGMDGKDNGDDDDDLSSLLQMPLMEMQPDGKVYFAS